MAVYLIAEVGVGDEQCRSSIQTVCSLGRPIDSTTLGWRAITFLIARVALFASLEVVGFLAPEARDGTLNGASSDRVPFIVAEEERVAALCDAAGADEVGVALLDF